MATLLPGRRRRVVFTSGATEANALALLGRAPKGRRTHVVVSAIEHPSVLRCARELERRGCELTVVAPKADGLLKHFGIKRDIVALFVFQREGVFLGSTGWRFILGLVVIVLCIAAQNGGLTFGSGRRVLRGICGRVSRDRSIVRRLRRHLIWLVFGIGHCSSPWG
jgi:hypothetical protein